MFTGSFNSIAGLVRRCSDAFTDTYTKCGEQQKPNQLFNTFFCTALIERSARSWRCQDALNNFEQMQLAGIVPNVVMFLCILKACSVMGAIDKGEQIHEQISRHGLFEENIELGNALVDMYAKSGASTKAQQVLDELLVRDIVSWSALIGGYAHLGQGEKALKCFDCLQQEGLLPNAVTFLSILKACGCIGAVEKGKQIHGEIIRQGLLGENIVLGTALIDMYAKCGVLAQAQKVLDELPVRDVVSWSALISGYAQEGQGIQALNCFERMHSEGLSPNIVTFICLLKACGRISLADKGGQIHGEIIRCNLLGKSTMLGNALVDMYAKCGALEKAQEVLEELPVQNVVSWNSLIAGYVQQDQGKLALKSLEKMQKKGLSPNAVTYVCVLKACGNLGVVDIGEQIHDEIARRGLLWDNIILGNALVDMYAKCGALLRAQQVLEELRVLSVVSWSALIAGYVQQGQGEQALKSFSQMQRKGITPNAVTFISILKACGCIGALETGEQIHDEIVRQGDSRIDILGNALVNMYAKCGALSKAAQVLEELPIQDIVSWSALIGGYAQQGQVEQALNCLEQMQLEGLFPDGVIFIAMLKACGRKCLIEDAVFYFAYMSAKYGVMPDLEHYTSLIDVLGRAGHLDRACNVIQKMPTAGCSRSVWSALLGACLKWVDIKVGRWAFKQAVKIDENDAAAYVLMASIYAAIGMCEDAAIIEAMRVKHEREPCSY